jgi:glyoxylase-like metal-dependent hydrolase (beta-lactamase superfamily II)
MFSILKELEKEKFFCKATVYLPDRPGALAELSGLFAEQGINIVFFYYNRSEHPNRVLVEGVHNSSSPLYRLQERLKEKGFFEEKWEEELQITELKNVLKIAVYLENVPGTLSKFSSLLKDFQANVIYMRYHQELSENRAEVCLYVKDASQLQGLLRALKDSGYYYNIEYSGEARKQAEELIGLNLVERFYLRLKEILGTEETEKVRSLVEASKSLSSHLLEFNKEAGKYLEAGQIFSNILAFALTSRLKTGDNFFYTFLPVLPLGEVLLFAFRLPTGGNVYVFKAPDGRAVMFDGGYGIYYEDVKKMLLNHGIEPSRVERIYLSHGDADHAGLSGYFEREFGTKVVMHPLTAKIIEHENRAYGVKNPIERLNAHFTVLVNRFTEFLPPENPEFFENKDLGSRGGFKVIDRFEVFGIEFLVLESRGGHVPGQVFFLSEEKGLLFTADYLLNVPSLREEEKRFLSIPKFLMTSTNTNSVVFREEMRDLGNLALEIDRELQAKGKGLFIFPGHGDYYPARLLLLEGTGKKGK